MYYKVLRLRFITIFVKILVVQQAQAVVSSCGVYARGKFCGNLKVPPPERQATNQ